MDGENPIQPKIKWLSVTLPSSSSHNVSSRLCPFSDIVCAIFHGFVVTLLATFIYSPDCASGLQMRYSWFALKVWVGTFLFANKFDQLNLRCYYLNPFQGILTFYKHGKIFLQEADLCGWKKVVSKRWQNFSFTTFRRGSRQKKGMNYSSSLGDVLRGEDKHLSHHFLTSIRCCCCLLVMITLRETWWAWWLFLFSLEFIKFWDELHSWGKGRFDDIEKTRYFARVNVETNVVEWFYPRS